MTGVRPEFLGLLLAGMVAFPLLAPGTAAQGREEERFEALRASLMDHTEAMPPGGFVAGVNESFEQPLQIDFPCPPGSPVERVRVRVTTTYRLWEDVEAAKEESGIYLWNYSLTRTAAERRIHADNVISLDPEAIGDDEGSPLARMSNLALVYHEFLHGQLVIDTMRDGGSWQQDVCEGEPPRIVPVEEQHMLMAPLMRGFMENLSRILPNSTVVASSPVQADGRGGFRFFLGTYEDLLGVRREYAWQVSLPTGANVDPESLDLQLEEGSLFVEGRLGNREEPGFVLLQLDPPGRVFFAAVEAGVERANPQPEEAMPPATPLGGGGAPLLALLLASAVARAKSLSQNWGGPASFPAEPACGDLDAKAWRCHAFRRARAPTEGLRGAQGHPSWDRL